LRDSVVTNVAIEGNAVRREEMNLRLGKQQSDHVYIQLTSDEYLLRSPVKNASNFGDDIRTPCSYTEAKTVKGRRATAYGSSNRNLLGPKGEFSSYLLSEKRLKGRKAIDEAKSSLRNATNRQSNDLTSPLKRQLTVQHEPQVLRDILNEDSSQVSPEAPP